MTRDGLRAARLAKLRAYRRRLDEDFDRYAPQLLDDLDAIDEEHAQAAVSERTPVPPAAQAQWDAAKQERIETGRTPGSPKPAPRRRTAGRAPKAPARNDPGRPTEGKPE